MENNNSEREWNYTGTHSGSVVASSAIDALLEAIRESDVDSDVCYLIDNDEEMPLIISVEVCCAETGESLGMEYAASFNNCLIALDAAMTAYNEHGREQVEGVAETPEWEAEEQRICEGIEIARAAFETARKELAASDELRVWCDEENIEFIAPSVSDALDYCEEECDRNNEDAYATEYYRAYAQCDATGESGTRMCTQYPDEPACTGGEHDWQSPHSILGGCKENPGVFGHGGGVRITEVCSCCGMYKVTDTWATIPHYGEIGDSIEYREADGASAIYAASVMMDEADEIMNELDSVTKYRSINNDTARYITFTDDVPVEDSIEELRCALEINDDNEIRYRISEPDEDGCVELTWE